MSDFTKFTGNDKGTGGEHWYGGSSKFEWNFPNDEIIARKGFGKKLNYEIAKILIQYYENYVPYKTGDLSTYVQPFGAKDHATVTYQMPYASAQYFGDGYRHTKTVHPLATSYWDKAAWNASEPYIMRDIEKARRRICNEQQT